MLIVRRGEHGPRVVALQILLNRRRAGGITLAVDGRYGPKTADAVRAYRGDVMRMSGRDNEVGPDMWRSLLRGTNLQIIDAVDVTDPDVMDESIPPLSRHGRPIATGGMSNGVAQVLSDIRRRGARAHVLSVRFHGHGGPGIMAVSHGTRRLSPGVDPNRERTVINQQTLNALRPVYAELSPLMCDFGFFEFHGCKVARGYQGRRLLHSLSDVWHSPVSAATGGQIGGGHDDFVFEGRAVTAYPNSSTLRAWATSRREARGVHPTP